MEEIVGDNEKKVTGTVRNSVVENSKAIMVLLTKNI